MAARVLFLALAVLAFAAAPARTKATFTPAGGKAIVVRKRLTLRERHR
jgi:hypothetical protein